MVRRLRVRGRGHKWEKVRNTLNCQLPTSLHLKWNHSTCYNLPATKQSTVLGASRHGAEGLNATVEETRKRDPQKSKDERREMRQKR